MSEMIENLPKSNQARDGAGNRWISRLAVAAILLVVGVLIFVFASNYFYIFPTNRNVVFSGGLTGILLVVALLFRRSKNWRVYGQAAYSFFVAAFVFFITTLLTGYADVVLRLFRLSVDTSAGIAVAKVSEAVLSGGSMLLLIRLGGFNWDSVFLKRGNLRWGLFLGLGVLVNFSMSAFLFFAERFSSVDRLLAAAGWGLVFSLANGFLEELWFRGLLLKRLTPLVGTVGTILLTSLWFSLAHSGSLYVTPVAMPFMLVYAFTFGVACSVTAFKTDSLLAPILMHAAADIFLFIAMLSKA